MIEIVILFSVYVRGYFFYRNSAIGMLDEVRTNLKLFPKHYVLPPRWMRKHFNLKKNEIPKYLCFRFCVSVAFGVLAPITTIVCLCTQWNTTAIGLMLLAPCFFAIPDAVQFIIVSHIFKKR